MTDRPIEAAQTSAEADWKAVLHAPSTHPCAMCSGKGFYGIPGGRCRWCDGKGEVRAGPLASAPPAAAAVPDLHADWKPGMCLPDGVMFDSFGNPRARYVRVIHDGSTLVIRPEDLPSYQPPHDDTPYTFKDVYLSKEEFDGLPEFDGF